MIPTRNLTWSDIRQVSCPFMRFACALTLGYALLAAMPSAAAEIDWSKADQALGKSGSGQPGGVHKYSLPRTDMHVTVDGVAIMPSLALGSWIALEPMGEGAMLMGDLVLTGGEIAPVMAKLFANGITVTALHNHLLRAEPAPFYMHIAAEGDPVKLAAAIRDALQSSATPFASEQSVPAAAPELDTVALDHMLGYKGKVSGGIYQFAIPRAETITDGAMPVPPAMGTATSINFQSLGGGRAAITGDFVLVTEEVPKVLHLLREHGIEVTAVHNHMLGEQPRLIFVHFWAVDNAETLARGLHPALTVMHLAPPG